MEIGNAQLSQAFESTWDTERRRILHLYTDDMTRALILENVQSALRNAHFKIVLAEELNGGLIAPRKPANNDSAS